MRGKERVKRVREREYVCVYERDREREKKVREKREGACEKDLAREEETEQESKSMRASMREKYCENKKGTNQERNR